MAYRTRKTGKSGSTNYYQTDHDNNKGDSTTVSSRTGSSSRISFTQGLGFRRVKTTQKLSTGYISKKTKTIKLSSIIKPSKTFKPTKIKKIKSVYKTKAARVKETRAAIFLFGGMIIVILFVKILHLLF